ncbi:MAG: serine--tRNA ligase, partial [Patescibacteria group bacterium]
MIDLAHLRAHPDLYENAARVKGIKVDIGAFLKLDQKYRDLLKKVEEMRSQQKKVSKEIPGMKGAEKEKALSEMKKFSGELKDLEEKLRSSEEEWKAMHLLLPNLPHARVPVGKTDQENKEVKKWGDPSTPLGVTPPSKLKDHVFLGEALDILDFQRGVKVAGTRGYFLKGDGARLQQAVLRFTLDHLLKKGWTLFSPPLLATYDCFVGTGFFPGAGQLNIYT